MTKMLFDAFREAMLHNPSGSRKEAQDRFIETMMADTDGYIELLAADYFERMAAVYAVSGDDNSYVFERTEVSREKGERISASLTGRPKLSSRRAVPLVDYRQQREESAKRTEMTFDAWKARVRKVILLDLEMPDGKKLRHATGAECPKAGGFYAAIAKHLKPTQVVDRHLGEGDLQNIKARFYQANVAEAA